MSDVISIRVETPVAARLREESDRTGETVSACAARLVQEGLRMRDHPAIVFRDGPSGRRAGLASGPDVWEVVDAVRRVEETGDAAVRAVAEWLGLPERSVRDAIAYYAAHPDEVDRELERRAAFAAEARARWDRERALLG